MIRSAEAARVLCARLQGAGGHNGKWVYSPRSCRPPAELGWARRNRQGRGWAVLPRAESRATGPRGGRLQLTGCSQSSAAISVTAPWCSSRASLRVTLVPLRGMSNTRTEPSDVPERKRRQAEDPPPPEEPCPHPPPPRPEGANPAATSLVSASTGTRPSTQQTGSLQRTYHPGSQAEAVPPPKQLFGPGMQSQHPLGMEHTSSAPNLAPPPGPKNPPAPAPQPLCPPQTAPCPISVAYPRTQSAGQWLQSHEQILPVLESTQKAGWVGGWRGRHASCVCVWGGGWNVKGRSTTHLPNLAGEVCQRSRTHQRGSSPSSPTPPPLFQIIPGEDSEASRACQ